MTARPASPAPAGQTKGRGERKAPDTVQPAPRLSKAERMAVAHPALAESMARTQRIAELKASIRAETAPAPVVEPASPASPDALLDRAEEWLSQGRKVGDSVDLLTAVATMSLAYTALATARRGKA